MSLPTSTPEFSVVLDLAKIQKEDRTVDLNANAEECARITKRLNVINVRALSGKITLSATKSDITAIGRVCATLTRECVASLEEMEEKVDDTFEVNFLRQKPELEAEENYEDWELPEVHEGDVFDIGELLVQQLSLAMLQFPRKEGAVSLADQYGDGGRISPFADLADRFEKE